MGPSTPPMARAQTAHRRPSFSPRPTQLPHNLQCGPVTSKSESSWGQGKGLNGQDPGSAPSTPAIWGTEPRVAIAPAARRPAHTHTHAHPHTTHTGTRTCTRLCTQTPSHVQEPHERSWAQDSRLIISGAVEARTRGHTRTRHRHSTRALPLKPPPWPRATRAPTTSMTWALHCDSSCRPCSARSNSFRYSASVFWASWRPEPVTTWCVWGNTGVEPGPPK